MDVAEAGSEFGVDWQTMGQQKADQLKDLKQKPSSPWRGSTSYGAHLHGSPTLHLTDTTANLAAPLRSKQLAAPPKSNPQAILAALRVSLCMHTAWGLPATAVQAVASGLGDPHQGCRTNAGGRPAVVA
jgi:hypothetical protein